MSRPSIEAIFRSEWPALVATLTRIVRDVGLAEELAQDTLVTALERWPADGIPDRPGAWLVTTGKHRALDRLRHARVVEREHAGLAAVAEPTAPEPDLDDAIGDDLLKLVFTACHPVLSTEARVALTLRLLEGLTTTEIARAFLVSEPTIQQRIVRAKRTLAEAAVGFAVPSKSELPDRLGAVLEVIYLVFNEGYAASSGDDWMRPELCAEALRLGRVVGGLMPEEPEAHALVALMELQASRLRARTTPAGEPILLLDQDRTRWDRAAIVRALAALARVLALGGERGRYALQAQLAACHARAATAAATDWPMIAQLYAVLAEVAPSPVVELNRAVAVGMAEGPAAGLRIVNAIAKDPALATYHLLPSVRADLLAKLGRIDEAKRELARAAALAPNAREKELLFARAAALTAPS